MNKYQNFDFNNITWGYRDLFKNKIDKLFENKLLGENEEVTKLFFKILKKSENNTNFDHVIKVLLESFNNKNSWILKIPALFSDWINLGKILSDNKMYMGLKYFDLWNENKIGSSPEEVQFIIDKARFLLSRDVFLAYNFLKLYFKIKKYLKHNEVSVFLGNVLRIYRINKKNAYSFLKIETKTSIKYLKLISTEIRLNNTKDKIQKLALSITGENIIIDDFSNLDSDEIIEKGSKIICMNKWFFFPSRVYAYNKRILNLNYYYGLTILCSSCYVNNTFSVIHGDKNIKTSIDLIKYLKIENYQLVNNFFYIIEI